VETIAEGGELCAQLVRQPVTEPREMRFDRRQLGAPRVDIDREQLVECVRRDVETAGGEGVGRGQTADRRVDGLGRSTTAREHPREDTRVLAVAGPQELAVDAFAEPVDVE